MYRVQLGGNEYRADEVGLHYQIHRGIGAHPTTLEMGKPLPVHIYVGGPPSLTVAAVMPLPEAFSELRFAGLLGGRRTEMASVEGLALHRCWLESPLHQWAYNAPVQADAFWRSMWAITASRTTFPCSRSMLCTIRRGPSGLYRRGRPHGGRF